MPHVRSYKSSFTAGELSDDLLGRSDLRAYGNGARTLHNVVIHPTGGVSRRPGLRFVNSARGPGRLINFEFNVEQVYLLILYDRILDIYFQGSRLTTLATPWTIAQIGQINWTQSGDTLLIVHPEVAPKSLTRLADGRWDLADWVITVETDGRQQWPFHKFEPQSYRANASATTGTATVWKEGGFTAGHVGSRIRLHNGEIYLWAHNPDNSATGTVAKALATLGLTTDYEEQAWSGARGWPASVCFHQDRLVVGGSRDLPNNLWMSKSSDFFNFDTGEGLDDEAIDFPVLSDQVNAIRHVSSGRHLQVFTSGAEWMVSGDPLTPTNIQVHRQTRVGSPVDHTLPPCDVDGATLFVSRSGSQIREFLYTDAEEAYQANDLTVLSSHLLNRPIDMDFDKTNRLLHVVNSDGRLATLTVYRDEAVNAWTMQTTSGSFKSVASVGDEVFVLVERSGGFFIEVFDRQLHVDSGLLGTSTTPTGHWSGVGHLEGQWVAVVADGVYMGGLQVVGGAINLAQAAKSVQLGLPFTHIIEPLPAATTDGAPFRASLRPISINLQLKDTAVICLDTGKGTTYIPLPATASTSEGVPVFSGCKRISVNGWRRGGDALWRIEQNVPLPFTLLGVDLDLSVSV